MTKLVIDAADAQRIVDYLAGRPYVEVFELIELLLRLPKEDE